MDLNGINIEEINVSDITFKNLDIEDIKEYKSIHGKKEYIPSNIASYVVSKLSKQKTLTASQINKYTNLSSKLSLTHTQSMPQTITKKSLGTGTSKTFTVNWSMFKKPKNKKINIVEILNDNETNSTKQKQKVTNSTKQKQKETNSTKQKQKNILSKINQKINVKFNVEWKNDFVTSFIIDDKQITSLPSEIGKLYKLETLIIKNCQLNTLPDSINDLTELKKISFYNNNIKKLPNIDKLKKLTEINLMQNNLEEVSLKSNINLKRIYLAKNKIHTFHSVNETNSQIDVCELQDNKIKNFTIPDNIKKIDASHNIINEVNMKQNSTYPILINLDLRNNRLEKFPNSIFQNIEKISLSNNFITNLKINAPNIKEIYIGNNRLKQIPMFNNSSNVEVLYIPVNLIYNLELSNIPSKKFKDINVSFNYIHSLKSHMFTSFKELNIFNIKNNPGISSIDIPSNIQTISKIGI